MNQAKILIVAPSSYPIHGAESNVNAKIIKVLSENNCTIDLVSRDPRKTKIFYPISKDDFFFGKVRSISLVKTDTSFNVNTILKHVKTFIKTGNIYKAADWAYDAIKVVDSLIQKEKYDFIYTFDYPSEIVGIYVAKKYRIKWVGTWNDPYMLKKYPKPYGLGFDANIGMHRKKIINEIAQYSYKNAFPSARLKEYMSKYIKFNQDDCVISPHILLNQIEKPIATYSTEKLRIIHSGALGIERNPMQFLRGLRDFIDTHSDAKITITFLGIFEKDKTGFLNNLISEFKLEKYTEIKPPVPYIESLDFIRKYDACLLIEANCEEGIFLPSKVVDYLQINKPIIAISPQVGTINDLEKDGLIDYFGNIDSATSISNAISKLYNDFKNNNLNSSKKNTESFNSETIWKTHKKEILYK